MIGIDLGIGLLHNARSNGDVVWNELAVGKLLGVGWMASLDQPQKGTLVASWRNDTRAADFLVSSESRESQDNI
jgi:hypothetical protein